jgi:hypothetical protein
MPDPVDIFADGFNVQVAALGCVMHFNLTVPGAPPAEDPTALLPSRTVATVRVTPEFLKGMTFLLRENIRRYEQGAGFKIELPPDIMAVVLKGSDQATWDRVWKYD